jgi:hypothetical protein
MRDGLSVGSWGFRRIRNFLERVTPWALIGSDGSDGSGGGGCYPGRSGWVNTVEWNSRHRGSYRSSSGPLGTAVSMPAPGATPRF